MTTFIHEREDWPRFRWDNAALTERLAAVRHRQGRLIGRMASLGLDVRNQATLSALTEDAVKTSAIEGETIDPASVRSSLARRLGIDIGALTPSDRYVDGLVETLLDATQQFELPLTHERLFRWHASLFQSGWSGSSRIDPGAYRLDKTGPMQVVSGPMGRERVHFEAPAAARVHAEMTAFLDWCNGPSPLDGVVRAAIAHVWFVTIHPFEDANGRIARAIADLFLARSEKSAHRFYSMSAQIRIERNAYYGILESTQRGELDITAWIDWFLGCLDRALTGAEDILAAVLAKSNFWRAHAQTPFNPRQRIVINRLLDGFLGKMTTSKWAKLAKCSQDTALRDIEELLLMKVFTKSDAGGRSTSYDLVIPPSQN